MVRHSARTTRYEFPQTRTPIGLASLGVAIIALAIAYMTGIWPLLYVGGTAIVYGMLMLVARMAAGFRDGGPR
jgi:hypothetical protein